MLNDTCLAGLGAALRRHVPRRVRDYPGLSRAAVALVVRPGFADLELLLIKRAPRGGDPWSGHMALPGGRQEPRDADPLTTAIRETLEEVGIDLGTRGRHLGALDDVQPVGAGVPPIVISPFVLAVPYLTHPTPNVEVDAAMWVGLSELSDPAARAEYLHHFADGRFLRFPALAYRGETIWGLTYRILSQFLGLAGSREATG